MQRGFGSHSSEDEAAAFDGDPHVSPEAVDGSLGLYVAPTDREKLVYIADLISQFQSMAIDMRLGMLARILSVAVAETGRLLEGDAGGPARSCARRGNQ